MDPVLDARQSAEAAAAPNFKSDLIELVPALRAFARSLSGRPDLADDLTQETLLRAWGNRESFTPGTNLKAWLFTILRNAFYTSLRKKAREVEDPDDINARNLAVAASQEEDLGLKDLQKALKRLPDEQREAIILVGASGCSYEEAASICGCAVGTIKSRVSRARRALLVDMDPDAAALADAGADTAGEASGNERRREAGEG